ncbi:MULTISPECIES: heavy metal translocating P-type ATPase [Thiorhodovibrio]|uniref:heavy metal translocating P-type ATPase n=1 Tax=Thiorhodovibrio TaxID=61593 RepID=UPI001911AC7E|nr:MULTISPECIES: heavy metal translocating P-type ATPase [Thiorhodovibrio]MBK5967434.1 heavy metal translocating P-type ATPase [Thiorhodovibrio winogradskyi]WPL12560.1 Copper-exporting P-type ATPase A [Thiorhodovibrio litoralis]
MIEQPSRCFHCGLPVTPATVVHSQIGDQARDFCCHGCEAVCQAIHRAGLEGFYQRTPDGEVFGPPPELPRQLDFYDLDEVQQEFAQVSGDAREAQLSVEGIHCAACVWLIENGLGAMPGVAESRVNLTGRRLTLRWDNARLRLSQILRRLGELGYAAVPFDPRSAELGLKRRNRTLLYRMAFAGFAAMNLMWISIALYAGADRGEFRELFHWIGCLLATPVLIYSGWPFFTGAWRGLRRGHLDMDLPIAIGAGITYLYSLIVTLTGQGDVYWDTVVNFLFVILLGRYLEAMSRRHAVSATQRLLDLQPKAATLLRDGEEALVPIRALRPGDLILIRPGEAVPADGTVERGDSQLDEALLTGESKPVVRGPGQSVAAGTMNGAGALQVRVAGVLRDTQLGRILHLVEEAQASKAPIQSLADRVVPWFVGATLLLALLTALLWWPADPATAVLAATSVLIITCPCAFGLATPMAIAVATGSAARQGILIKNGAVLERLSGATQVVFDKTGTLTLGQPTLVALVDNLGLWRADDAAGEFGQQEARDRARHYSSPLTEQQQQWLAAVAALEQLSEHPLARALTRFVREQQLGFGGLTVEQVRIQPGRGLAGVVDGQSLVLGSADWLREQGIALAKDIETPPDWPGATVLHLAVAGTEVARLLLSDDLRQDAQATVNALLARGLQVSLLSGDRQQAAVAIAQRLGNIQAIAEVLPEGKAEVIAKLRAAGQRVVMVGDGVNDAPALVSADIGMALGSGTDVSMASADIILTRNELTRVPQALALAQRTLTAIRQNIGLSIVYNLIMVPLAMAAMITPLVAAIAMPLSSLAVIGNSARIASVLKKQGGGGGATTNSAKI